MFEDTKVILTVDEQNLVIGPELKEKSIDLKKEDTLEYFFVEETEESRRKAWEKDCE